MENLHNSRPTVNKRERGGEVAMACRLRGSGVRLQAVAHRPRVTGDGQKTIGCAGWGAGGRGGLQLTIRGRRDRRDRRDWRNGPGLRGKQSNE